MLHLMKRVLKLLLIKYLKNYTQKYDNYIFAFTFQRIFPRINSCISNLWDPYSRKSCEKLKNTMNLYINLTYKNTDDKDPNNLELIKVWLIIDLN